MSKAVWVIERMDCCGEWVVGLEADAYGTRSHAKESLLHLRKVWPSMKYRIRKYKRSK